MYYYDWTYILVIIGVVICGFASANVKSTYAKYKKFDAESGVTAEQVAATILQEAGIDDVSIGRIAGDLTDHYSPKEKVLRLSDSVYGSSSIAAIGVAAHECGHAIQHHKHYFPLTFRSVLVPVCNIGSALSWPVIIAGLILGMTNLALLGVILFSAVVFFQLVTLPVEFNASSRALKILRDNFTLDPTELKGARKVLKAAALTYVAALLSSILQMLRLLLIVISRRD